MPDVAGLAVASINSSETSLHDNHFSLVDTPYKSHKIIICAEDVGVLICRPVCRQSMTQNASVDFVVLHSQIKRCSRLCTVQPYSGARKSKRAPSGESVHPQHFSFHASPEPGTIDGHL